MIRAKKPRGGDTGSGFGIMFFSFISVIILRGFRSCRELHGIGTSVPAPVTGGVLEGGLTNVRIGRNHVAFSGNGKILNRFLRRREDRGDRKMGRLWYDLPGTLVVSGLPARGWRYGFSGV